MSVPVSADQMRAEVSLHEVMIRAPSPLKEADITAVG
jgi:hypothetical protein